ncbi:hypothetical protein HK096_005792 [Nowakowskiella sp. JEL0078]|nr:hypothetical protein HK096_005792 [Nowakowskiella sp. JEL0078]
MSSIYPNVFFKQKKGQIPQTLFCKSNFSHLNSNFFIFGNFSNSFQTFEQNWNK